ncbi:MAG: hypothetical protein M1832_004605 [Thelocarpon impressellum]|nr:MAG: hypothetical protein M1832_004605 [Thelocarpon impressellum]
MTPLLRITRSSPAAIRAGVRRTHPVPMRVSPFTRRTFAAKTDADSRIEEIQELYATARDEFEIAAEETEKKSIYARDDREAAREELGKLKEAYRDAIERSAAEVSSEIKGRIGQRLRELESAVEELNKADLEE